MKSVYTNTPLGESLPNWRTPARPGPAQMSGSYVRLDRLEVPRDGPALFRALGQVEEV